jgi:hypothetical protein
VFDYTTRVNARRGFILVILVYVALDLSVAAMPGAFVFDAGETVESVQTARLRSAADPVLQWAAPAEAGPAIVRTVLTPRPLPRPLPARPIHSGDCSRRKAPEPPGLSEDPH